MDKNKSNENTYVKYEKNRKGEWEEVSICRINAEQAALFNKHTKNTGEKFELDTEEQDKGRAAKKAESQKKDAKPTTVKVGENEHEPKVVIDAINAAAFEGVNKLNANTGAVKVSAAFEALNDEQKAAIQTAIDLN